MRRHLGLFVALACGFGLFAASVLYQEPGQETDWMDWCRILSNAALIPGVLFSGISALSWIAGEGMIDGIKYATSSLLARIRGTEKRYATYLDYLKRSRRKGPGAGLLFTGLFFLGVAVLFTGLFYLT